jgi:FkbM family methyltransferase
MRPEGAQWVAEGLGMRLVGRYCRSGISHPSKLRIARRLASSVPNRVVHFAPGSGRIALDPREYVGWALLNRQEFEPVSLGLAVATMRALEGQAFLDVGAHHGLYSVTVGATTGCTVIAVEGQSSNFATLTANVRLNPDLRCYLIHCCASSKPGLVHLTSEVAGRSAWTQVEKGSPEMTRPLVATLPLEVVLDRLGMQRIGLMKIDVEGYELQVFEGLEWEGQRRPRHILMECSVAESDKREFLLERGYSVVTVDGKPLTSKRGEYPEGNLFFSDVRG